MNVLYTTNINLLCLQPEREHHCVEYATVHEQGRPVIQICGGQHRNTWTHTSESNSIDVSVQPQNTRANRNHFIIHFEGLYNNAFYSIKVKNVL